MAIKKIPGDSKKESFVETPSVLNAEKHPGAVAVNEVLTTAKANGTYFNEDKRGRPTVFKKGSEKPKKLTLTEELADRLGIENNDKIFANMVEAAVNNDMQAMLFFMERLYLKGKAPRHIRSSIRDVVTLADIDAAQTQIIKEAASGELDVDDAKDLFKMTVEKSELQVRQLVTELTQFKDEVKKGKK